VAIRRTTVAAGSDDLAVLESEARRRGVALAQILREAVEREADRLRRSTSPRFGIVRGDGTATASIARDEHAPARRRGRP
jgi:metallophosphoesterase superfamily enzyme